MTLNFHQPLSGGTLPVPEISITYNHQKESKHTTAAGMREIRLGVNEVKQLYDVLQKMYSRNLLPDLP